MAFHFVLHKRGIYSQIKTVQFWTYRNFELLLMYNLFIMCIILSNPSRVCANDSYGIKPQHIYYLHSFMHQWDLHYGFRHWLVTCATPCLCLQLASTCHVVYDKYIYEYSYAKTNFKLLPAKNEIVKSPLWIYSSRVFICANRQVSRVEHLEILLV